MISWTILLHHPATSLLLLTTLERFFGLFKFLVLKDLHDPKTELEAWGCVLSLGRGQAGTQLACQWGILTGKLLLPQLSESLSTSFQLDSECPGIIVCRQ